MRRRRKVYVRAALVIVTAIAVSVTTVEGVNLAQRLDKLQERRTTIEAEVYAAAEGYFTTHTEAERATTRAAEMSAAVSLAAAAVQTRIRE